MSTSKKCWECKSTESEEWHEYEMTSEDPISTACSDGPASYIVKTIDICDRCQELADAMDDYASDHY